jgi:hypothetical protein
MSGAVFKFYDRYLLPVIPLISVFFATVISSSATRFKKPIFTVFLTINFLALLISVLFVAFISAHKVLIATIVTSFIFVVFWSLGFFRNVHIEIKLACAILLLFFNIFSFLHPLLMPNPGAQLVKNIEKQGISKDDKIYV